MQISWVYYIGVFILVTLFVTGLMEFVEWAAMSLKHPINPIYLAAGAICGFLVCMKIRDEWM
jgi:hypothetical protein